jgi:Asparagine synthase
MRLRIVVGSESIRRHGLAPGLSELYRTDTLLIHGDPSVVALESGGQVRGVLAGRILGRRSGSGRMSRVDDPRRDLGAWLTDEPLDRLLDVLEGRFVLAQIAADGSCVISCDRFGQAEVYYHRDPGGGAVLATRLDLLPATQGAVKHDQLALAHAFSVYGYRPPKRHTFYDGVRRLGVREIVRCGSAGCDVRTIPVRLTPTTPYGKRELREYADLFLDAIDLRSSREGNVVYLSSGWDSTAILAGLVRLHGARKVRAVIGRMNFAGRSGLINPFEIDRARAVADYYGVRLDIVELDYHRRGRELIEQLQPLGRAHMLASMTYFNHSLLAEGAAATSTGHEAVFAGEISDGAHNLGFSQFVTIFHPVLDFREYSDKMLGYTFGPTFLQQLQNGTHLEDPVYDLLRRRMAGAAFDDVATGGGAARQLLSSFFLRSSRFPLYSLNNTRVLTVSGREQYRAEMEASYLAEPAAALTPETLYATYLHLYNSFHWQGGTVSTLAYTAGEHGLPMSIPFWDSRLQEFLSGMPESWGRGLDLKPTKYPLKWALEHVIDYPLHLQVGPHSYQYDVDPSFNHSAEFIYASGLSEHLKAIVSRRAYRHVLSPEVFDLEHLDRLVAGWLSGTEVRGADLSDLASLVLSSASGWYGAGA